jgi:hypothetical protein
MMPLLDAPSSVALMAAFALARAAAVKSQSTTVYLQKRERETKSKRQISGVKERRSEYQSYFKTASKR